MRAITTRLDREPAVVTLSGSTWTGVCDDIIAIGAAMGCSGAALSLVESLDARLRVVHDKLKAARAALPRVVVIEWTAPVFAAAILHPALFRAPDATLACHVGMHVR